MQRGNNTLLNDNNAVNARQSVVCRSRPLEPLEDPRGEGIRHGPS